VSGDLETLKAVLELCEQKSLTVHQLNVGTIQLAVVPQAPAVAGLDEAQLSSEEQEHLKLLEEQRAMYGAAEGVL
jgi:hypothetical protein